MKNHNKMCRLILKDPNGGKVEILINEDTTIDAWIEAFRKILSFQQFHPNNIEERIGDA